MSFLRNPRNLIAIGLIAVLLAIAGYIALGPSGPVTPPVPPPFAVNGKIYAFTYTATDDAQGAAGFMNKRVTKTTTMLFVFPGMGTYPFWMYDTNTSLDMIWIDATGNTGRVVYMYVDAQPCHSLISISCPNYPTSSSANYVANYVIEAKAGFAKVNGIEVSTQIQFGLLLPNYQFRLRNTTHRSFLCLRLPRADAGSTQAADVACSEASLVHRPADGRRRSG